MKYYALLNTGRHVSIKIACTNSQSCTKDSDGPTSGLLIRKLPNYANVVCGRCVQDSWSEANEANVVMSGGWRLLPDHQQRADDRHSKSTLDRTDCGSLCKVVI